eukprot:c23145_g1_i4 orf=95-295(+)
MQTSFKQQSNSHSRMALVSIDMILEALGCFMILELPRVLQCPYVNNRFHMYIKAFSNSYKVVTARR